MPRVPPVHAAHFAKNILWHDAANASERSREPAAVAGPWSVHLPGMLLSVAHSGRGALRSHSERWDNAMHGDAGAMIQSDPQ